MQIKCEFDITVATRRRFVVRQKGKVKMVFCAECDEIMLSAEQAAEFFGIAQRRVFQIIETGKTHFAEMQTGAAMICLSSLAAFLDEQNLRKKMS